MPPQVHVCNGLARSAAESMLAREQTMKHGENVMSPLQAMLCIPVACRGIRKSTVVS